MGNTKASEKAAILFNLIGEHIPKEVLEKLSTEELEKLMKKMSGLKKPTLNEERKVLNSFNEELGQSISKPKKRQTDFSKPKVEEWKLTSNTSKSFPIQELKKKKKEELELILGDETPRTIAMVMCFADPDEASQLVEDYPQKIREQIFEEIQKVDFYSEALRSELESFLFFKYDLIESREIVSKVRNRSGKKVAEILSRISPNLSKKLFSEIKEKNPKFASSIDEHFYTIHDLMFIGRTSLTNFLTSFHPIVLACAFKGIENDTREKLMERCDPWLSKQIRIEMDSMGPISLAEIEEAQKAIIETLNRSVETGKIKLWKVK
ncbi:MAG: FliG C-terminal domain-containing protein [Leptospiraceae bacterium]|nr:FliG C-terminal domain-containing protein [Leptospiraceae bacterium]